MAIFGKRRRRAITASAVRVSRENSEHQRRLRLPRQLRALEYYDSLGEIWYASQFYARALSRLDLYVGKRPIGADPNQEPEKIEDGPAVDLLNQIQDPGGGRANLLGSYGRLRFLVGEAFLVYTAPVHGDVDGQDIVLQPGKWEMLSIDEIRIVAGGGFQRMRAPGLPLEELKEPPPEEEDEAWEDMPPGTAVVWRLWKRHPRFSELADAPMFAVLDICEELLLLTLAVRSRASSRAAGPGILLVPEEIDFPSTESEGDEDPEADQFMQDLTDALTTPLREPGDASAVVPMIVRGQAEFLDKMRQLTFKTEGDYPEAQLRGECINRLATGLDMPKEALLGMADLNHWNAWQVDEDTWKAHLEPIAMDLCQDLTAAYLQPALTQQGVEDDTLVVWYDATRVINHPDKSANAQQLHDRAAISDEALRRENGFDETDKPDDAEIARRVGILTRDAGLAITGVPTLKQGAEPEEGVEAPPGDDQPEVTEHPAPAQEPPSAAPPPGTPSDKGPPSGQNMIGPILALSEMAVEMARAKAGARLRQALKKMNCAECSQQIDGVPNRQVAAVLGTLRAGTPEALPNTPPVQLIAGSMDLLHLQLQRMGCDEALARSLCMAVEKHTAATLFDSHPLPLSPEVLEKAQACARYVVST